MRRRKTPVHISVPERAGQILSFLLIVFVVILARTWHLSIIRHEEKLEEARRPQRRVCVERAQRGTIRDRFNQPLAVNKIQYNAAISYAQIREVPRVAWRDGKRVYQRKEHIEALCSLLGQELGIDAERIEDEIHSKAAIFPNVPYVIKGNLTETEYYRLRMLEKDWLGLQAEIVPRRSYPKGRVAADVLGYMGPINRKEYESLAQEMDLLQGYLDSIDRGEPFLSRLPKQITSPRQARDRLAQLEMRAYSIHDAVGKSGVEGAFDERLHGFPGRKVYQQDIYGNYIRPLPGGWEPVAGQRLLLTISGELQEYAEQLLIENEVIREGRSTEYDRVKGVRCKLKQPWIKGGAIVVLDPNTGEVLAMAGYPRFDPNDFIKSGDPIAEQNRQSNLLRWFETERHIGDIWDGKRSMQRETTLRAEEEVPLTWNRYLDFILPQECEVRKRLDQVRDIAGAIAVQEGDTRFYNGLDLEYDQDLLFDLCQVAVPSHAFSRALREAVGRLSLSDYREANRASVVVSHAVREMMRAQFHEITFREWRQENEKSYLRAKRQLEKEEKRYQRPYIDYLDKKERELFAQFWHDYGLYFVSLFVTGETVSPEALPERYLEHLRSWVAELRSGAHQMEPWFEQRQLLSKRLAGLGPSLTLEFLGTMRSHSQLTRPLKGKYRYLRGKQEKDLAAAFYPRYGFGYARSHAYRQAAPQGSIFKIVPAYEAIRQREEKGMRSLNPLTMVDNWSKGFVGTFLDGKPIPQRYKGGKLLKTQRRNVGQIDLPGALEVTSNCYFGLLAADHIDDPEDLNRAARSLGYGARTGIDIPGEYSGRLPDDLRSNTTGLYSYTDGQHSLVCTPLQTAVMLSTIANKGKVFCPRVLKLAAGKEPVRGGSDLFHRSDYPMKQALNSIGVDFPLFTSADRWQKWSPVEQFESKLAREVQMTDGMRNMLHDGLRLVVSGERGSARPSKVRSFHSQPWMVQDYRDLQSCLVGKTSTAEIYEQVDLDAYQGVNKYNFIWFGAISYEPDQISGSGHATRYGKPELVVVVYLRFADYGREAAPLAAQMVKKWREIKNKHRI